MRVFPNLAPLHVSTRPSTCPTHSTQAVDHRMGILERLGTQTGDAASVVQAVLRGTDTQRLEVPARQHLSDRLTQTHTDKHTHSQSQTHTDTHTAHVVFEH